jgi:hypothetical protein
MPAPVGAPLEKGASVNRKSEITIELTGVPVGAQVEINGIPVGVAQDGLEPGSPAILKITTSRPAHAAGGGTTATP